MHIEDLVNKAQRGDQTAFEVLCGQFQGLMKKSAGRPHLRSIYEEALGAAYESFIEAVQTYDAQLGVPFAGFAKAKVHFALWNLFKRERRRWQNECALNAEGDEANTFVCDEVRIEEKVERKILAQELFCLIDRLPAKQRQAILLTVVSGMGLTEAGRLLGVTPQAVFNLKKRAIQELKRQALSGRLVEEFPLS